MSTIPQTCENLWVLLKQAAFAKADKNFSGEFKPADRMREAGYFFLEDLLEEEITHERNHRKLAPVGVTLPVSARVGAMVTLLHHIGLGAKRTSDPGCSIFFVTRRSAAYAQSIGFLLRDELSELWIETAVALDYSAIMEVKDASK